MVEKPLRAQRKCPHHLFTLPCRKRQIPHGASWHPGTQGANVASPFRSASSSSFLTDRTGTNNLVLPSLHPENVERFHALINILKAHISKGNAHPLRSLVAAELLKADATVYEKAGVARFGLYAELAVKAGVIELGGKDGTAWVALRPDKA